MMDNLRVRLFGQFEAECNGSALSGLETGKAQELFCYLLLYRDRPHPREYLASLLWSETDTAHSRGYLRKALWQLQSALETHNDFSTRQVLEVAPDFVQVGSGPCLWLDVAAFEQTFQGVQGIPGRELGADDLQPLERAVQLYRGDLLEGWYQDWCVYERERLQLMHLSMLDKLMDSCEARLDCEAGLAYGSQILRFDRARERTHRRLMRLHYLAGDRTAALRQYERCVAALRSELGVRPARRTIALYEQIRDDQVEIPGTRATRAQPPESTPSDEGAGPSAVVEHLRRLCTLLSDAHRQLQHDLQVLESALRER